VRRTEPTLVHARIVSFGSTSSKTRPGQFALVELADGSRATVGIAPKWAIGCKAGELVALHRRGLAYQTATRTCRET